MFLPIASTGRTATSFVAEALNRLPGIAALHEGHLGNDAGPDVLPLVNLDNFQCFKSAERARAVVAAKRSDDVIAKARVELNVRLLVDVAYYNSVLLAEMLRQMPDAHGAIIIRDCASFVRSATWFAGTDPMPVGWPAPDKPLDAREKFISMGRIRPVDGPDVDAWSTWGAVERNIWLWRTTNTILCDVWAEFPARVHHLDFDELVADPTAVLSGLLATIGCPLPPDDLEVLRMSLAEAHTRQNERQGGYQLGDSSGWSAEQRRLLAEAQSDIDERVENLAHARR